MTQIHFSGNYQIESSREKTERVLPYPAGVPASNTS